MDDNFKATSESWQEYVEEYSYQEGFLGYLDATTEMVEALENLQYLEFDQMKAEITQIVKARKAFIEYALENIP